MSVDPVLSRAVDVATAYLDGLPTRQVPAAATADALADAFGERIPDTGASDVAALDALVRAAEPGLTATSSPRFFGFVIGGTYPVAIAADWLRPGTRTRDCVR